MRVFPPLRFSRATEARKEARGEGAGCAVSLRGRPEEERRAVGSLQGRIVAMTDLRVRFAASAAVSVDRWERGERAAEQREGRTSVPASGGGRWQPLALERVCDHLSVRLWVREKMKNFSADAERF